MEKSNDSSEYGFILVGFSDRPKLEMVLFRGWELEGGWAGWRPFKRGSEVTQRLCSFHPSLRKVGGEGAGGGAPGLGC